MKKIAYLLFICICLTSCKSCKNDTKTTVSGLVVDVVTGNPIANAKIFLGKLESGTYGISASTVAETTSDVSGRYSFEFDAIKGEDYSIIAKADKYFETESVSDNQLQEGQKNEDFNISLKPKAVIKIHVKKTDTSYDSLYTFLNLVEQGSSKFASGKNIDTNLFYLNQIGGINKDIYIYVKKFIGTTLISTTSFTNTVYLIPIDTTYLNLNY